MANRIINRDQEAGLPSDIRTSAEYEDGYDCFLNTWLVDECPYAHGTNRLRWMCGWYDARTLSRMSGIFKRHGLSWYD